MFASSFADLKRKLTVGTVVTLVSTPFPHKYVGVPRKIAKVQTNGICFEPALGNAQGGWLHWDKGAKAVALTADGFIVLQDNGSPLLTYRVGCFDTVVMA